MAVGLIGSTGFVGGTIARQRVVDRTYHRPDVAQIRGRSFSRLYLSAAPAQKWVADGDPQADAAGLAALVGHLDHVAADEVVLVSTIDVYPDPVGVDEGSALSVEEHPRPYGRHRLWLEEQVRLRFPGTLVVRLPGLFGQGLRKNLVYDLMHDREEFAHRDSVFQFYDLQRLCQDVDRAVSAGLGLVNLATEPVSAREVAREVFGRELHNTSGGPVSYDMGTRHAGVLGGAASSRYLATRDEVLEAMRAFVATERSDP